LPETVEEINFFEQEKQHAIKDALEAKQHQEEAKKAEAELAEAQERERIRVNQEQQAEAEREAREQEERKALIVSLLERSGIARAAGLTGHDWTVGNSNRTQLSLGGATNWF
jgi:DNA-binding helix-hairpin-helix protein with protein kinase domain